MPDEVIDTPANTQVTTTTETPATPAATSAPAAVTPPAVSAADEKPETKSDQSPAFDWEKGEIDWPSLTKRLAGDDAKKANILKRFLSPEALVDAYIVQNDKIRSGNVKTPLAKDATPEQIAQWRAENGVPESPDKYDTELPDGLIIGEQDKPIVDQFLQFAHGANLQNDAVKGVLGWYFDAQAKAQQAQQEAIAEMDTKWEIDTKASLQTEYGPRTQMVLNQYNAFMHEAPDGLADDLRFARMPNGQLLASDPRFIRWAAAKANELNPMASISTPAGVNPAVHVESRKKEIEAKMGSAEWGKMSQSQKDTIRAEHKQLVEVQLASKR